MEKTLNSISGGGGHGHAHGAAEPKTPTPRKKSKGRDDKRSQSPARQRKRKNSTSSGASGMGSEWDQVKPAAFLNWVADAMHNFCDGLALAVTFAAGERVRMDASPLFSFLFCFVVCPERRWMFCGAERLHGGGER
eukprot:773381-Rhodomonas_salina.1